MNQFAKGITQVVGVMVGFLPIAMSFGAIAVQSGVSQPSTVAMSVWIYAGASQFAAIEGVRQGLSGLSILLTVLMVNLRHIPMSLSAQKHYGRFSWGQQLLLSHGLIDETYALEMTGQPQSFLYYLGMHVGCWSSWVTGTWMGGQLGLLLPERWLQFALPALFLYLLIDNLRDRLTRELLFVISVGIALVLLTQHLGSTGILVSLISIAVVASRFPQLNPPVEEQP